MKKLSAFLAVLALCLTPVKAVSPDARAGGRQTDETPTNLFEVESSFVFESELTDDNDIRRGDQDAFSVRVEYVHLFHLSGHWYFRTGLAYDRFDFSETNAPVPDQLHSIAGVFGIDYMVGADRGAFLEVRPGFYAQNEFRTESFDVPITLARAWVLQPDKLFLITGVNAAFLRGEFPVLPVLGIIWRPNEEWTLYGVVPEPRLTYHASRSLDLWVGGELTGGSFRTDRSSTIFPRKLSNAQVDYSEYRGGLGVVFHLGKSVDLDLGGGYSFQRRFNFERADEEFTADAAPYVRAAFKAEF